MYDKYGPPEVLRLQEIAKPVPGDREVLIKILATTVTSRDWRFRKAVPFIARFFTGLFKPKISILGSDLAGEIEAVGKDVKLFANGDRVFGSTDDSLGAYAEYICMPETGLLEKKPDNINAVEAAAIFFGGHTALHFLRKGKIRKGQKVLVYGASGSVGTFAVQIANYFGAEVTGVCSTKNLELVNSLGAARVVDYTREDFSELGETFDIIFETVGKSSYAACMRSLKKDGYYLSTVLMTPSALLKALWTTLTSKKKVIGGSAQERKEDLIFLRELVEAGHLKPVIDRQFPLEHMVEAHSYVEKGHKRGNVVINTTHATLNQALGNDL